MLCHNATESRYFHSGSTQFPMISYLKDYSLTSLIQSKIWSDTWQLQTSFIALEQITHDSMDIGDFK